MTSFIAEGNEYNYCVMEMQIIITFWSCQAESCQRKLYITKFSFFLGKAVIRLHSFDYFCRIYPHLCPTFTKKLKSLIVSRLKLNLYENIS